MTRIPQQSGREQRPAHIPAVDEPLGGHSACGVGFVASVAGEPSRAVVALALEALARLEHRGGLGADGESSDGAGVLTAIPRELFAPWLAERGVTGPEAAHAAVGMVFLPREEGKQRLSRDLVEKALRDEGLTVVGWRVVPVQPGALGEGARAHQPHVEQVFAVPGPGGLAVNPAAAPTGDDLERALLLARRRMGAALAGQRAIKRLDDLYVCSLSARTIVYKGMVRSAVLPEFYDDLRDPAYTSALALFHRRFSTNTVPKWSLAQPMRVLAHNGEINTIQGNLAWMTAREPGLAHSLWGERLRDLLPPVHADSSDSGALDKIIELLVRSGRSPLEAMMQTMPEAYEHRDDLADHPEVVDFYDYAAGVQEAWDGPAMVVFSDGRLVGATVDRNGLRPARYVLTRSGLLAVASEAGAVPVADDDVLEKGRLGPGKMIAVDLEAGELLRDEAIKPAVAARRPYGDWLRAERRALAALPFATDTRVSDEGPSLLRRQTAAGYTAEDVEMIILPMALRAHEPRFSMGNDTPLAILSSNPHTLYDYFTERFAQVTNPPIDPLRERLVMSLATRLGRRGNLLIAAPEHAHQLELPSPVLNKAELAALPDQGLLVAAVATDYDVTTGPWGLRDAVTRLCAAAADAVRGGAEVVVLSDRLVALAPEASFIPPLLAVGAVHHHLIAEGLRCRASLVVETAQCWSVHHFACLVGYGASAVAPHLAFETVRRLWSQGRLDDGRAIPVTLEEAQRHFRISAERGLLKILSKMGISLLSSYHGAQLFEAVGIGADLLELGFHGTPSRIGGLSVEELAQETVWIHQQAFPELTPEKLHNYGFIKYRRGGEYHLNNPEAAKALRRACVEGSTELYEHYRDRLAERPPTMLRDLFKLAPDREPVPLDEVEPASAILRRFSTGGMSLGALSREAHETMAVAMNRIGGRSNSGEGGEDAERYRRLDDVNGEGVSARFPHLKGVGNGDSAVSAIKQVASGRFGVGPEYLVNAEQLEIKIAQGAKPGEGGELPGEKVTPYIAGLRRAKPGLTLISPPPHHDIYSIEDLAQLVYDLTRVNPQAEISVKLVAGSGIGTIAAGVAKAGADVIHVSGHGGGTAAASLNSIKHAGIPWELGLAETHGALLRTGFRERVRLRVDGDLRTGKDVVLAAVLGAQEFSFGTAVLLAEGCVMARVCHMNKCPVGIATQDEELRGRFTGRPEHVVNFFTFVAEEVRALLAGLGFRTLEELVGHTELLELTRDALTKTEGLDVEWLEAPAAAAPPAAAARAGNGDGNAIGASGPPAAEPGVEDLLLADPGVTRAIAEHGTVIRSATVCNADRTIGARLAGVVARAHGDHGFRGNIRLELEGAAGQSLGAFILDGVAIDLCGETNDFVGKGMAGGEIVLRPPVAAGLDGAEQVIAGNTCLYGATGGALFAHGRVGERFAVRNSRASAVIEGAGDHCCEYMTGGVVVVVGSVGRNACAGMTGGTAYLLSDGALSRSLNTTSVYTELATAADGELLDLLRAHVARTGSPRTAALLATWPAQVGRFVKVSPRRR